MTEIEKLRDVLERHNAVDKFFEECILFSKMLEQDELYYFIENVNNGLCACDIINRCFSFSATKDGFDFWWNIAKELRSK